MEGFTNDKQRAERKALLERLLRARREGRCSAVQRNQALNYSGDPLVAAVEVAEGTPAGRYELPALPLSPEESQQFGALFAKATGIPLAPLPTSYGRNDAAAWLWDIAACAGRHAKLLEQVLQAVPHQQKDFVSNPHESYEYVPSKK